MDLSDDLPPPRRPLFFPVVIATVLLSVIGMSAGLVLGSRRGDSPQQPGAQATTPAVNPVSTASTAEPCRTETQLQGQRAGASGTLRVALKLRTSSSTVWICSDDVGRLYYHANRGGESAPWVENKTALFLPDVHPDGDGYEVTATNGTSFSITTKRLKILHKDGKEEIQDAAD